MHCDDKVSYRTERQALNELAEMRKAPNKRHDLRHLTIYYCATHVGWHLGRDMKSIREATGPVPSAAKLRRKLAAYDDVIHAQMKRFLEQERELTRKVQERAEEQ